MNASKGAAVIDQLIGITVISTTICHECKTVSNNTASELQITN